MTTAERADNVISLASFRLGKEMEQQIADKDILPTGQFLSRKLGDFRGRHIRRNGQLSFICYRGDLPIEIEMWSSGITSIHWKNYRKEELWGIDESKNTEAQFALLTSRVLLSELGTATAMISSVKGSPLASVTLVFNRDSNPVWDKKSLPKSPRELPIRKISQIDQTKSNVHGFSTLDEGINTVMRLKSMIAESCSFSR